MPTACGIALGLDRLVMLVTGAARLDEVLWNPLP
jgi:lysyl-tRNA synthetase class 2